MKRYLLFVLILILTFGFLVGCGKNNADILETPEVADSDVTDIPESEAANDFGHNASVELISTASYIYDGVEGSTLYGAIEYKNTGDCPVYLSKISYQFSVNGTQLTHDYTPPLGEHTIVLPGESSYEAIWLPAAYESDADVALTASLFCVESSAPLKSPTFMLPIITPGFPPFPGGSPVFQAIPVQRILYSSDSTIAPINSSVPGI